MSGRTAGRPVRGGRGDASAAGGGSRSRGRGRAEGGLSTGPSLLARLRASELLDLVLPRECGGCLRVGADWCRRCERALGALAFPESEEPSHGQGSGQEGGRGGGPWVVPHPVPDGMPPVHAWGVYADPLRAAVSAWKDAGRRDLVAVLEPLLTASLVGALHGAGWSRGNVLVVPAPSSRKSVRERGDTPMTGLCASAVAALAGQPAPLLRMAPALRHVRRVEDQSGLGTVERRGNLDGALAVSRSWHPVVAGRRCLLVDDVVTTGATLAEAARALRSAGAADVVGASLAATQRTRG